MPSFICPFCSLNCSGLLPGSDGKSVADINWLCKAGKTALQQAVDQSHSPEIDGIPVNWEDGFINSQNQISAARFPLVIISGEVSCETQQLGLQLAGLINAVVDTPQSRYQGIASQWVQEVGSQTFTLGETKASQAAHLYWGIDPGDHIPCPHEWVLNSIQRPSTLEINYQAKQGWGCSHAIVIEPGSTLTLLQKARLALRTTNKAGEPLVNQLLDFFQSVDSGVVFIGSRFLQEGGYALLELQRLLEDLWEKHAWRSLLFDFEANSTGGGEALTARTGFSQSVLTAVQPQDRKSSVASAQELIDKKQTDLV
ncbi:MAG TPA: hypothetical protein VN376_08545, partial [Longilinea sp.]|nr:hypothetical protein [Longilinea sp.]